MGFRRLVIVNPRFADYREHPEAVALATGGNDVLAESQTRASLSQALEGVTTAYAMTGYDRQFGPPMVDVRRAALQTAQALSSRKEGDVAFVFGTERDGLRNEDVERCQFCCAIPASAEFSSLNLAQAVQVTAYECQLAVKGGADIQPEQARFVDDEAACRCRRAGGFVYAPRAGDGGDWLSRPEGAEAPDGPTAEAVQPSATNADRAGCPARHQRCNYRISQRARGSQETIICIRLATIIECLPSFAKTSTAFCSETLRHDRAGKC